MEGASPLMASRCAVILTPSRSSHPTQLLSRQHSAPISPLAATLMDLPTSVANKGFTRSLSLLAATLTKNRGVGAPPFDASTFNPACPLLSITRHLFTLSGVEGSLFSSSPFNRL